MRRCIAILVFVTVASPVWTAALVWASDSPSQLPICCRRDGKHHCAMLADWMGQNTGPAFSSSACPYRSGARTWTSGTVRYSHPSGIYFGALLSHPAVQAQTEAKFRLSVIRANLKRGPPVRSL
jgi:hypothetical protein